MPTINIYLKNLIISLKLAYKTCQIPKKKTNKRCNFYKKKLQKITESFSS